MTARNRCEAEIYAATFTEKKSYIYRMDQHTFETEPDVLCGQMNQYCRSFVEVMAAMCSRPEKEKGPSSKS